MPNPLDTLYDQLKGQYPDLVDRSEFIGKLSNDDELKKLHDAASKDIPGFVDFDNFKSKVGESLSTYDQDSDYKAQSAPAEQESAPTDVTIPRREKGRHVPPKPQNGGVASENNVPVQPTDTHVDAEPFDRETGDLDELGRRYEEKVKRLESYGSSPNLYVNEEGAREHYEAFLRLQDEAEQDRLVYNRRVKAAEDERAEQQRQLDLQSKDRKTRRTAEYGGYTNDEVRKEQERLKKERAYLEDPKSRRNADYSKRVMEYNADQTALSGEADKRNKRAESKRAMYDEVKKVAEDPDVQRRITGNDTVAYVLSGNNPYALQNYDAARERAKTMTDEELVEHCKAIAGQKYARGDNKDVYAPLAASFLAYHNELMYRLGGDEPKSALEMRYDMIDKVTEGSPEGDEFMVTLRNYLDGTSGMGTANFENDPRERANIPQFAIVDEYNRLVAQNEEENMRKVEQIGRYPQQEGVTDMNMAASATDINYDAILEKAFEQFGDENLKAYIAAHALRNGISIDESARRVNQSIWNETLGKTQEQYRPKSGFEFFVRRVFSDNMFSKLGQIGLRARNGTLGSNDPFMMNSMALDEYAKDHPVWDTAAVVTNFAVLEGPIFSGYGKLATGLVGAGERAIIGAVTKTADKMAIDSTVRALSQSLAYRLARGGATGALVGFQYGTMSGAIDQAYYDGNVNFGKVIANGLHMGRDFAIMHGVGELFGVTGDAILSRGQRAFRNGQGKFLNRLETASLDFLNSVAKTTTNAAVVTGLYAAIDKPALERENKKIEAENKKIEAENARLPEDKQKPLKPLNQIASVEDTFYSSLRMFAGLDAVGTLRRAWSIGVRGEYERNKHVRVHFDKFDREALEKAFGKNPNSLLRQIVFGNVDGIPAKWFEIDPEAEQEIYKELGRELTPAEKEAYATYGLTELRKVILNKDIPWATRAKIVSVITGQTVQEPPVAKGDFKAEMDSSGTQIKRIIVKSLDLEGNVIQVTEFSGKEFEAARRLYESLNDRGWRNNAMLCGDLVIDAIEDKTYADTVDEMAREKGISSDQFEKMVFGIKQKDITGEKVTYQERQLVDEFDKRHQQKQKAETELAGPNKLFEQVAREVFGTEWKRAMNIPRKSWASMSEGEKEFVNKYIERMGAMGVAERNKLMNANPDWARTAKEYEESVRRRMAEAERPAEAEPLPALEDEKVSVEIPDEDRVEPVPDVIELEEEPGKEQPTQSAGPQDTPAPVEDRPAEPAKPVEEEKQQAGTIGFEPVEQPTERERFDAERKAKAATITDADIEANREALGIPDGTALTDEARQIYAEDLAEDLMRYERFKRGESDEKARFHDYWESKFNPKRPKLEKPAEKQEEPEYEEEDEVTDVDALIEQFDNLKGRSDLERYRHALEVFAGDDEIMDILEDLDPHDIYEWVASSLGLSNSGRGYSMLWESKTRNGNVIAKGFKEETGWSWNDAKGFAFMFDNKNGLSPRRIAEIIWADLPSGMKDQYSDVDVFNIMMDLFKSSSRKSDLTGYIRNNRLEQVRELLTRRRSAELDAIARDKERVRQGEEEPAFEPVAPDESSNEFAVREDDVAPFSLLSLNYRSGEVEGGTIRSRARTRKQIGTIAKALGYKIRWVADKSYNAKIDTDEKVLYLNIRTDQPLAAVMGHEVTHDLRKSDPKAYEALKRYAQDLLGQEQWDSEVKDVTDVYNEEYKRRGWQPIRADKAEEEVVCDTMGKLLHSKSGLRELAGSLDTTVAGKVYRLLKDITDKVKSAQGKEHDYGVMDSALQEFIESVEQRAKKGMPIQDAPVEETTVEFSLRKKPAPKNTGVGYKVFFLKDGKLYPPMVANIGGEATPFGVWLDADAAPIAGQSKTGRNKVKAGGKGTQGGSGTLAYRPGWHLGKIPYALQFNRGKKVPNPLGILNKKGQDIEVGEFFPNDFVWAEVEYAADKDYQEEAHGYGVNANGKYNPSLAGLPRLPEDGSYEYRTNPNPATDPWIITGAMKVNKILKPSEVDEMVRAAGREPQKRQEGAFTDEQIDALNKQLNSQTTDETVHPIQGLDGYTEQDVLDGVRGDIEAKLEEAGVDKVAIKGMALHGSRMRGDARADSDLDVVVEYEGDISEDGLFNILNDEPMYFDGVKVDINPITRGKSGTLEQYMERSRRYDEEKLRDESSQSGTSFSLKRESRDEDKVPTFYSNAAKAVDGVKQNKATAEQWKAMLTKAGGIKAGEDKWMGLSQWLDEHKGETLTKDQVLEFVRDNGIKMEEVGYSEAPDTFESLKREYDQWLHDEGFDYAQEQLRERFGEDAGIAFDDLGGELVVANEEAAAEVLGSDNIINSTRLDYTTEGLENKREIAFVVPGIEPYQEGDEIHFGPENQGRAVMWVRFGEATDSEGKRVLVIDEIQSNRHQDAREKGYEDPALTERLKQIQQEIDAATKEFGDFNDTLRQKYGFSTNYTKIEKTREEWGWNHRLVPNEDVLTKEEVQKWKEGDEKIKALRDVKDKLLVDRMRQEGVPAAPFEKNWHEVAMKRMLRLAAEEGFDKVAWTTGEQQSNRYDLSSAISGIEVRRDSVDAFTGKPEYDKYNIWTYDDNGNVIITASGQMEPEKIVELFGKDLGNRILATEEGKKQTIMGEGLTIGGEGMKGFYDQMLPRFMDKYGKRWGVKVGEVTLNTPGRETMHSVDVNEDMKRSVMQGQPLFSLKRDEERTLMGVHNITSEKLRSALKLGGLANPSMAVIDTKVGGFDNFGEISLIPGSDLIASRTGRNAGTWGADAYSPRFPETHRRLGKGGDKKMRAWVNSLGMRKEMVFNTEEQFNDYYNGFNIRDNALVYPFLHEKGLSGEVDYYTHMNVDSRLEDDLREANGDQFALLKRFDEDNEYKKKLTDIVVGDEVGNIRKKEGENFHEFRDRRREWAKQIRDGLTGEDGYINRNLAEDLLYAQARAYRENGKFHESYTHTNAEKYISDHGMEEEYKQYFDDKMQELGAEAQVYAGSDSQGRSKFKPVSLDQVSRMMKKQGRAGGEGGIFEDSPGAIRAKLLTPMKTLDQIRKEKGRIASHEQFEQTREEYQDELREYADRYTRGSAGALADIITSRDMVVTAKRYNIDLDADAVADLNRFKEYVRKLPTEYFETKFERPVMLNEFKKAVVPDNLPLELYGALQRAGLEVVEYPAGDRGARERMTLEAVKGDQDVLFSLKRETRTDADGNKVYTETREDGTKDREITTYGDGSKKALWYDDAGVLKERLDYYPNGEVSQVANYDNSGNLTRHIQYDENRRTTSYYLPAIGTDWSLDENGIARGKSNGVEIEPYNFQFSLKRRTAELDKEYVDAIKRGDEQRAVEMLLNKLQNTEGIVGYVAPHGYGGSHRDIAKRLKTNEGNAVVRAVADMQRFVPDNAVLVPMPPHEGEVTDETDTMILADALSVITGKPVVVALEGEPRESRYAAKAAGRPGITADEMGFRKIADIPEGKVPIIIDNVVGTGETAKAAVNALGGGITLAYAKATRGKVTEGLKNATITYDDNGNLIPLSQRFDLSKDDVRYSLKRRRNRDDYTDEDRADAAIIANTYLAQADALRQQIEADRQREHQLVEERNRLLAFDYPAADPADRPAIMDRINDLRNQINDLRNANYENNTKLRSMDYEYRVAKEILEQGAVTDEEAARFDAGQMTREEKVLESLFKAAADSRADKKAKQKAIRGLVRELAAITDNFKAAMKARGIESQRKHYDKGTVDHIIRLAKAMMGTGYIDNMTSYEVKRLMGMINNAATRESIETQAGRIVDMMLDHQIRTLRNDFNKQLKVTGQKTNSSGVQVQAGLDQEGQVVMEAMRKSMQIIADSAGERYDNNGYLTEWGEFYEKTLNDMGDADPVKAEQARKIFEGVWLASKWYNDVRALEINGRILRSQMEDFKASNKPAKDADADTKQRYNDVLADYQEMLRQNKIKIIEAYERMTGEVGMTQADSMRRAKEFADAQKQRVEEIQHNANSDLEGVDDSTQVETPESRIFGANKNNVIVRLLFASAGTYEKFMRFFGRMAPNGEGYLFKRFMTQYHHARQDYWKGRHSAFEEMDKKMAEVFGKKKMHWSDIYEMTRDRKKFPPITVSYWDGYRNGQPYVRMDELNQSEALYLYMINKMADGRMKLRHMGITDDVVQQMAGQIDGKLIQLADWLQSEFLPKMRVKYNETHKRVFGADMAAIEDYFPLRVNKLSVASDMDITERDMNDNKPSTITGAIVKRRVNTLPIDLHTDAFDVALSHIDEMEHWSAFAEFNRDNNTLVNYKRFRTKVNNMRSLELGAGNVLWKNFTDAVAIAADAYHPAAGSRSGDHYATRVAKFVSTAKIALRPYTALKQLLSIPAFWADSDPLEQIKATVNVANTWQWAIDNLPGFAERWQGRQAGNIKLANYNELSGLRRRRAMRNLQRAGMWANAAIDGLACAMGGKAVYETKYKRYLNMGYDDARAKEKALIDAAIAYNNSQQSSEGAYVSPLQVDRTWFANAFSVFRSASMGYTRRMNTSLRQLRNATFKPGYGAKSVEFLKKQMMRDGLTEEQAEKWAHKIYRRANLKAAASVAIFGQILPFTWNLGANMFYLLFGDDNKEKLKILADSFRHSFFGPIEGLTGGNVISELGDIAADTAIGKIWGDGIWGDSNAFKTLGYRDFSTMPLSSDLNNVLKYFARDEVKAANEVVNILFQVATGVNPQTITDWATAILDFSRSDMERRDISMFVMRLLSTPQSQLDKFYLDQMNITQEQADKMSVDDLIKRYATYKRWRETPLTGWWMYSDEREKKVEEKFQKRYEEMLEERSVAEEGLRGTINDIKDLPRKRTMMDKLQKELTDSIEAADPELYKKALEGEKADDDEYVRHVTDKDVEQMAELTMKKKALRAARDRKVKADKDAEAGRITQEEYDAIYKECAHQWKLYNYLNNTLPKKLKEWKLKMEPDMQDKYTPEQIMDSIRSKTDKALRMRPEDMKMKKGDKKKVKKNKKK